MHREKACIDLRARTRRSSNDPFLERPREQRFRPGSRLSNWKNEANARYRHGGQVSLTLSNRMAKLENEIRMLAMACGEEAQNLNTYRLTPGLLWIAATHLDEPSDYLS